MKNQKVKANSINNITKVIINLLLISINFSSFLQLINQTLNGFTPAEASGIQLGLGENKWLDLIRKSVEK